MYSPWTGMQNPPKINKMFLYAIETIWFLALETGFYSSALCV